MDAIWKQGGVDYKMNSYQCVPTSHNEGLIEIVPQAQTICQIQMEVRILLRPDNKVGFNLGLFRRVLRIDQEIEQHGLSSIQQYSRGNFYTGSFSLNYFKV